MTVSSILPIGSNVESQRPRLPSFVIDLFGGDLLLGYGRVPHSIGQRADLSDAEVRLSVAILSLRFGQAQKWQAPVRRLTRLAGWSERKVYRVLETLRVKDVFRMSTRSVGRATEFELVAGLPPVKSDTGTPVVRDSRPLSPVTPLRKNLHKNFSKEAPATPAHSTFEISFQGPRTEERRRSPGGALRAVGDILGEATGGKSQPLEQIS